MRTHVLTVAPSCGMIPNMPFPCEYALVSALLQRNDHRVIDSIPIAHRLAAVEHTRFFSEGSRPGEHPMLVQRLQAATPHQKILCLMVSVPLRGAEIVAEA